MTIIEKLMLTNGLTKKEFAHQLGITSKTLSKKFNGISQWRVKDIHNIGDTLKLDPKQLQLIFFGDSPNDKKALNNWSNLLDYFIELLHNTTIKS